MKKKIFFCRLRQSYLLSRLFLHILCILFRQIFSEGASEEYLHEIANWPMPVGGWPANCKELTLLRRVPKARRGSIVLCLCVFFCEQARARKFQEQASEPTRQQQLWANFAQSGLLAGIRHTWKLLTIICKLENFCEYIYYF